MDQLIPHASTVPSPNDHLDSLLLGAQSDSLVLEEASKAIDKLVETEAEVKTLSDEVNQLKLELTKSNGLVSRFQADKDASDRKHAALVGMLEAQLSELNETNFDLKAKYEAGKYELDQKEEEIAALTEQVEKSERSLKEQEQSLAEKDSVISILEGALKTEREHTAKAKEALALRLEMLKELSNRLKEQEQSLAEKDTKISSLEGALTTEREHTAKAKVTLALRLEMLKELCNRLTKAKVALALRLEMLKELSNHLKEQEKSLTEKDTKISSYDDKMIRIEKELKDVLDNSDTTISSLTKLKNELSQNQVEELDVEGSLSDDDDDDDHSYSTDDDSSYIYTGGHQRSSYSTKGGGWDSSSSNDESDRDTYSTMWTPSTSGGVDDDSYTAAVTTPPLDNVHPNKFECKASDQLPHGWIVRIHQRKNKRYDLYWYTNTGKRLRSNPDIVNFLSHLEDCEGDEEIAWERLKNKVKPHSTVEISHEGLETYLPDTLNE